MHKYLSKHKHLSNRNKLFTKNLVLHLPLQRIIKIFLRTKVRKVLDKTVFHIFVILAKFLLDLYGSLVADSMGNQFLRIRQSLHPLSQRFEKISMHSLSFLKILKILANDILFHSDVTHRVPPPLNHHLAYANQLTVPLQHNMQQPLLALLLLLILERHQMILFVQNAGK